MTKIITIAGLPCCGKTTLCNNIATTYNGLSLDLEYLRTIFFEENFKNNVLNYTHNEPVKDNEDLRTYFLRCVIYENVINLDEYVKWYEDIMEYMDKVIPSILEDFESLDYQKFLDKHNNIIKWSPASKPDLIVINHALLPLTNIWENSTISIMLTGSESILVNRFVNREEVNKEKYETDILRHMKLYNILNTDVLSDFTYDTTNDFLNISDIIDVLKERGI